MRRFEWDPHKADLNVRKHGVRFDLAAAAFMDPLAIMELDLATTYEQRWRTIGMAGATLLLMVVHKIRDEEDGGETVRIISARRVEPRERRRYERGKIR